MKHIKRLLSFSLVLATGGAFAQSSFINLNFESVVLPLVTNQSDPYQRVFAAGALPGWNAYLGDQLQSVVLYNNRSLDSSTVGLVGPGPSFGFAPIGGFYSAQLQAKYSLSGPPATEESSLRQTGFVPADTKALYLEIFGFGNISVMLGEQTLSLIPVSSNANYTLYGADVSAWANQTAELRLMATPRPPTPQNPFPGMSLAVFDGITFSPNPIPEPGTWALLGLGAAAWFLTKGRRR
jgi:hypothetical protein